MTKRSEGKKREADNFEKQIMSGRNELRRME